MVTGSPIVEKQPGCGSWSRTASGTPTLKLRTVMATASPMARNWSWTLHRAGTRRFFARPWRCPRQRYSAMSDPALSDTDGDLLDDAYELSAGSDAFAGDSDGDGLSDGRERGWGSDPNSADTDGDGFGDGEDAADGFTPVIAEERIDSGTWAREFGEGVVEGTPSRSTPCPNWLGSLASGASSSIPVVGAGDGNHR